MHKLIMTSTVYRQSSRRDAAKTAVDAENAWYGRYPLRRLDAESMRDTVLAASGRLDCRPFGPAAPIEEDFVGQVLARDDQPRRSIYVQVRRTKPVSFLAAFDAPVMAVNCDRRSSSTAAPQSLMLMNSDFILKHAERFAERVRREAPREPTPDFFASAAGRASALSEALSRQVALAWRIAYQRAATADELPAIGRFLKSQSDQARAAGAKDAELAAMTNLCQQLLSSNEFLYVD